MDIQAQTTSAPYIQEATGIQYGIQKRDFISGTNFVISNEQQSVLIRRNPVSTDFDNVSVSAKTFKLPLEKQPIPAVQAQAKKSVDGVILSEDDATVKCELYIDHRTVTVQLPRALFPDSVYHGLPIKLEMIEESGIRKPKISVLEIEKKNTAKIAAEFDSIINSI